MKKLSIIIALLCAVSSFNVVHAEDEISVILNGSEMEFDTSPEIVNDRTFVPLRAIAEALESLVDWDGETQGITITKNNTITNLQIGNTEVRTSSEGEVTTDVLEAAPYIKDDYTMVPLRFISEAFGMDVKWDGGTKTVTIDNTDEMEISYYEGFETVPDFGTIYGYDAEMVSPEMDGYYYNGTTAEDRDDYKELLEKLGFVQVDEMVNNEVDSYGYEKDNIQVVTSLYKVEYMNNIFGISILHKSGLFEGEIKYYKDFPKVPDFGIIDNVSLIGTDVYADNISAYNYKISSVDDLAYILIDYTNILNEQGFTVISQSLWGAVYSNQESENTVIIQAQIDENNDVIIIVAVEQWAD